MKQLLTKVFGDGNSRQLKKLEKVADQIEELEPQMQQLSDYALQEKTDEFKKRYQDGESLDDLLPEAYAVVREASKRVLGMRPVLRPAAWCDCFASRGYSGNENR